MDYVKGRACKISVKRTQEGNFKLPNSWYDHSEKQYDTLLEKYGVKRKIKTNEKHGTPGLGVPAGCTLSNELQIILSMDQAHHPCDGCNMDRETCLGYERKTY